MLLHTLQINDLKIKKNPLAVAFQDYSIVSFFALLKCKSPVPLSWLNYYNITALLIKNIKQTEDLLSLRWPLKKKNKNNTILKAINQNITLRSKMVSLFLDSSKGLFHIFLADHSASEEKLLIPWQA